MREHTVHTRHPRYKVPSYKRGTYQPYLAGLTPQEAFEEGQLVEMDYQSIFDGMKLAKTVKRLEEIRSEANQRADLSALQKTMINRYAEMRKRALKPFKFGPLRVEKYHNLHVYSLTPEQMKKDPDGYKYLVREGALSHSAFRTIEGLTGWLTERGLALSRPMKDGEIIHIKGSYKRTSYGGTQDKLDRMAKRLGWRSIAVLDNGEYVQGYVRKGNEVVYMNPNFPRNVLPYKRP